MTLATILPVGRTTFVDANNVPLVGGSIYMYYPNTTSFKTTWQDALQTTPNSNPIILDGNGSCLLYGIGQYTQEVFDASNNLIWTALTTSTSGNVTEIDVTNYGAVADAVTVSDIVCTNNSPNVSSASANFTTSAKAGQKIKIYDVANNVYVFLGSISQVVNNTTLLLSGNASASTVSGNAIAYWGTDNATAINSALTAAAATIQQNYTGVNTPSGTGYATVKFPVVSGIGSGYLFASTLVTTRNVLWSGPAMLFSAVGNGASDRTWAITCTGGIQIDRIIMEVGGGMGIQNGTIGQQSSSFITQLQIWNAGTNFNGGLAPASQIALELNGNDYTITKYWSKGGNIAIWMNQVSDMRMSLPEIIGAASAIVAAGCENCQINKFTFDTCSFAGFTIDGCHNFFADGNTFSVNNTGLTYAIALGLNDHTNINKNIRIGLNAQRCGGILAYIDYTQDSTFDLLGSNSSNYSGGGVPITYMVQYGTHNVGMLRTDAVRDNVTAGHTINNYTGTSFGTYADYYNNSGTFTQHFIGTFTNP